MAWMGESTSTSMFSIRTKPEDCRHEKLWRFLRYLSHSAIVKVAKCKDCGREEGCGWYQEGETWE